MDKPVGDIVYNLEDIEEYIRQEEKNNDINLWHYYKDSRDWCGNGSCFIVPEYDDIDEVDMELRQWTNKERLEYKNSKLLYKYFPDATYFRFCW